MIECKLEKATETYTSNIKKLQDATSKKIHELTAYLQIEVRLSLLTISNPTCSLLNII